MFTIGCDPELFIENKSGECVPVFEFSTGTKEKPAKTSFGALQVDGMALEFNIDPTPLHHLDFRDFLGRIQKAFSFISKQIPEDFSISKKASYNFPDEIFLKTPDYCKILGCDPDYNAYTGLVNPRPDPVELGIPNFRTAGGHIHIGWAQYGESFDINDKGHIDDCRIITKILDHLFYSDLTKRDPDKERVNLYGGPGVYRPKPYGVEYRSLSNFWCFNQDDIKKIFMTLCNLEEILNYNRHVEFFDEYKENEELDLRKLEFA